MKKARSSGILAAFIFLQPFARLMLHPSDSLGPLAESLNLRLLPMWRRDAHVPTPSAFQLDGLKPSFRLGR